MCGSVVQAVSLVVSQLVALQSFVASSAFLPIFGVAVLCVWVMVWLVRASGVVV